MQMEEYIQAGKIASEVREMVRVKDWVGKTVYEICEWVEDEIRKRGAKCAFPVNTSINEVAAHYTAEPNDPITIKDTDLIKIDLGAQINGYIADTAVTVCYDPQYDGLVQAAEEGLANAMSMIKAGVKASDIGRTIETTIKQMGYKPIANLSGHSLEQYTIHAGKSIPNIWSIGGFCQKELCRCIQHRIQGCFQGIEWIRTGNEDLYNCLHPAGVYRALLHWLYH